MIFNPSSTDYYKFFWDGNKSYEIMENSNNYPIISIGFCWVHIINKNIKKINKSFFNMNIKEIFKFSMKKYLLVNNICWMNDLIYWRKKDKKYIVDFIKKNNI